MQQRTTEHSSADESSSVLRNSVLLFGFHAFTKSLAFISFILLALGILK